MSNCFRAASRDPETAKKKTPARSSQTRTTLKEKVMERPGRIARGRMGRLQGYANGYE